MKKTIVLVCTLLVFAACKPSVKNEINKWGHNQKNIQSALMKYPNFSKHATPLVNKAKADWQKAQAIEGEEDKAAAMKEVNNQFSSGLLNKLSQVYFKSKSIDDDIRALAKKKISKTVLRKVNSKVSDARKKQSEARRLMYSADTSTLATATDAASNAISRLIGAASNVSSAQKLARKKK